MTIQLQLMRSIMYVGDLDEAIAFWTAVGLVHQWRFDGKTSAVGMGAECLQVMLIHTDDVDDVTPQTIHIALTGVDAMHARCVDAIPERTGEVGDREYGMRDFSIIDPWGHMVLFGESLQTDDARRQE